MRFAERVLILSLFLLFGYRFSFAFNFAEACGDCRRAHFLSLSKLSMSKIVGDMQHEKGNRMISFMKFPSRR